MLLRMGQRMSLTRLLRSPGSPVRAYLDGVSPWLTDTMGASRDSRTMAHALGLAALARSRTLVPPLPGVDTARAGTAIDLRARMALTSFDPRESTAAQGVALLPFHAREVHNGAHRARVLEEAFDVAIRILDAPADEGELDRACLVLAHCEQVYRVGASALAGSLGDALDATENGLDFALRIDVPSLDDLRALMKANADQINEWHRSITKGERFESNPSFVGSALVGGADADWIVGDVLIDSKAYAKLSVDTLRGFIRQLLGYVMLDLDDAHGIRAVGLWLPRQGLTRIWSLERLLNGKPEALLPKLRAGFRAATADSQLAVREHVTQRRKHQILADNKHTPRSMLVDLASSADVDIRFRVGRNTASPEETVRVLARDRYARAREGVARNENAPVDVLRELSHDRSLAVQRAAAANPRLRQPAESVGSARRELLRAEHDATKEMSRAPTWPATLAGLSQEREAKALDTKWFADFLAVTRSDAALNRGQHRGIPVPEASARWAREEGRALDVPIWLSGGLPDAVKHDLMRDNRPAWIRRTIADSLPISDPRVRDKLLADADPEIRWSALKRSVEFPDAALTNLLAGLAASREERIRFRVEGDERQHWERPKTPAEYEREALSLVASHPSTPQAALSELLESKTPDVLVALVENPALPADNLTSLLPRVMAIRSPEVRARLAASPRVPAAAARVLARDRNVGVRLAVARNNAAPLEALEELAGDTEHLVRLAVATNAACSADTAAAIIKPLLASAADVDLLDTLRAAGAREDLELTVDLLADALDRLSKSRVREPDVRRIVAGDERASSATLLRLARSSDNLVRDAVARNASTPATALTLLAADSVPHIRASVATSACLDPALLATLAHDEEPTVRARAAGNPRLAHSVLSKLLHDTERRVRSAAYWNPSTPPGEKAKAEAAWEQAWRDAAPSRKELEERVASNHAEVRMEVAFDPRTPADILVLLGGERRSARVRRAVAANPNTPPDVLVSLADDEDTEVRQAVALNRATPPALLSKLAGRGIDLAVLVALNPDTPMSILHALSEDHEPLVRHVAAKRHAERAALAESNFTGHAPAILH